LEQNFEKNGKRLALDISMNVFKEDAEKLGKFENNKEGIIQKNTEERQRNSVNMGKNRENLEKIGKIPKDEPDLHESSEESSEVNRKSEEKINFYG